MDFFVLNILQRFLSESSGIIDFRRFDAATLNGGQRKEEGGRGGGIVKNLSERLAFAPHTRAARGKNFKAQR